MSLIQFLKYLKINLNLKLLGFAADILRSPRQRVFVSRALVVHAFRVEVLERSYLQVTLTVSSFLKSYLAEGCGETTPHEEGNKTRHKSLRAVQPIFKSRKRSKGSISTSLTSIWINLKLMVKIPSKM